MSYLKYQGAANKYFSFTVYFAREQLPPECGDHPYKGSLRAGFHCPTSQYCNILMPIVQWQLIHHVLFMYRVVSNELLGLRKIISPDP